MFSSNINNSVNKSNEELKFMLQESLTNKTENIISPSLKRKAESKSKVLNTDSESDSDSSICNVFLYTIFLKILILISFSDSERFYQQIKK